jgi:hypothetical protein
MMQQQAGWIGKADQMAKYVTSAMTWGNALPNPKTLFREQEQRDRVLERITIWQAVSIPEDLSTAGAEWPFQFLFAECG